MHQKEIFPSKPNPFTQTPTAFYALLGSSGIKSHQKQLFERAVSEAGEHQRISDPLVEELAYFPQVVEYLLLLPDLPEPSFITLAKESPQASFHCLRSDYQSERSALLELLLLTRPEFVCRLLLWAKDSKSRLRKPLQDYFPSIYSDWYWAHFFYSYWAYPGFFSEVIAHSHRTRDISPNSILTLACLKEIQRFSEEDIEILSTNASVAFQAAIIFPNKVPAEFILAEAAAVPQWAFHILTRLESAPPAIRDQCHATLLDSPPWAWEYIAAVDPEGKLRDFRGQLRQTCLGSQHPVAPIVSSALEGADAKS